MDITGNKSKSSVVLELRGRLDTISSDGLRSEIEGLMERGERQLMLDFSGLNYVSSSGLRVLMTAAKRVKAVNGMLALVSLNRQSQVVFQIAGFSSVFTVYPSQEEAVDSHS
jgi:anti-sigma B factor antagonist